MNIAVFCGAALPHNPTIAEAARDLGRHIALAGHTLVYGGSNLGLMGAVSDAALQEGGHVVGVIPSFFSEETILSQPVTKLVRVSTLYERKERILDMSDAFVALPGGIGTLDEVHEVLSANILKQMRSADGATLPQGKPMVILNFDGYYDPFLAQLDHMREEGLLHGTAGLLTAATPADALSLVEHAGKL